MLALNDRIRGLAVLELDINTTPIVDVERQSDCMAAPPPYSHTAPRGYDEWKSSCAGDAA